jgi:hypothetical protein
MIQTAIGRIGFKGEGIPESCDLPPKNCFFRPSERPQGMRRWSNRDTASTAAATKVTFNIPVDAPILPSNPIPLLLFSVLYGFWVENLAAFNGNVVGEARGQFLALAEKQGGAVPLTIGHRLMGTSLLWTGDIAESRAHADQAIALYDPKEHRPLAMRFGKDVLAAALCFRALALWVLGYPEAALADADHALKDAREIGHSASLMHALYFASWTPIYCGNYAAVDAQLDELSFWRTKKAPRVGSPE